MILHVTTIVNTILYLLVLNEYRVDGIGTTCFFGIYSFRSVRKKDIPFE